MFTLPPPKKKRNQGILLIFHLFQWWVYQPDILLPGSVTELQGEIKEATKRLSDLQKSSNELKMDRQALGPFGTLGTLGGPGKSGREICSMGDLLDGDQMDQMDHCLFFIERLKNFRMNYECKHLIEHNPSILDCKRDIMSFGLGRLEPF